MRKGKSVVGKPLLSLADGERVHEVRDVILGSGNDAVVGLLADEGGFLASSLVVPFAEVVSFGRDAVVIARRESVIAAKEAPEIESIVARDQSLLGTRVFTETGDDQGKINDVYFDDATGRILGLELSGGMFADAARGRVTFPSRSSCGSVRMSLTSIPRPPRCSSSSGAVSAVRSPMSVTRPRPRWVRPPPARSPQRRRQARRCPPR